MFVRIVIREDPDQMLLNLQKQPGLGLHCLSSFFWQATSVWNFRTCKVICNLILHTLMAWK